MINREKKILTKINFILLYTYLITVSFAVILKRITKFENYHTIVSFILLITLLLSVLVIEKKYINRTSLKFGFIGLLYIFSTVLKLYQSSEIININILLQSFYSRLFYIIALSIFTRMFNKEISEGKYKITLIKVVNFITFVIALFAIIELFQPEFIYKLYGADLTAHRTLIINGVTKRRLISIVRNPINLGYYMAIGIASNLEYMYNTGIKTNLQKIFRIILIGVYFIISILTLSRSAMLASSIVIIVYFIFYKNINFIKVLFLIYIILFVLLIVRLDTINIFQSEIFQRIKTINVTSFRENVRFARAETLLKSNTFISSFLGNGVYINDTFSGYVLEFGYASIFYEVGLVGLMAHIHLIIRSIKNAFDTPEKISNNLFYFSIVISAVFSLLTDDIHIQRPYNIFFWFSIGYLNYFPKKQYE